MLRKKCIHEYELLVNILQVVVFFQIFTKSSNIQEALYDTIHVAGIAQILQTSSPNFTI